MSLSNGRSSSFKEKVLSVIKTAEQSYDSDYSDESLDVDIESVSIEESNDDETGSSEDYDDEDSEEYDEYSEDDSEEEEENSDEDEEEEEDDDSEEEESSSEDEYNTQTIRQKVNESLEYSSSDEDNDSISNFNWNQDAKMVYVLASQEPSATHIFNEKPYYYLTDSQSQFIPEFDSVDREPVNYYLYLYILCNNTNYDPYLSCMLQYDEQSKMYNFPSFTYKPIALDDNQTHDTYILNMCYDIIYPLFDIHETDVTEEFLDYSKECFKGSYYYENMSHGYIAFNVEKFIAYLKGPSKTLSEHFHKQDKTPKYSWAILDEIVNQKKIHNIGIHPDVRDTFDNYEWIKDIRNEENEVTEIPKMLYSCIVKKNKIDTKLTEKEQRRLLPPKSNINGLDNVYVFIDSVDDAQYSEIFSVPRYAVFLGNMKKLDNETIDENILNLPFHSFQMKIKDQTIYAVTNGERIYKF